MDALLSYGIKTVAVTHGSEGCKVFWHGGKTEIPVFFVNTVDATGASDTFSATFLYGIDRFQQNYETAAEFAAAAAAICVSGISARAGAVPDKTVHAFIENYKK